MAINHQQERKTMSENQSLVGFTCAYTPLPLIHAAGFVPYRVLPISETQEQAGALLHDNMCPHVKRILDRVLSQDLPMLQAVVVMESCDTMRRLAEAWRLARPEQKILPIDLPTSTNTTSITSFAKQLARLSEVLEQWSGSPITEERIRQSVDRYNTLYNTLHQLAQSVADSSASINRVQLQEVINRSVTQPIEKTLRDIGALRNDIIPQQEEPSVPILLIGNVLPDPQAFELFSSCGVDLISDELCTSNHQIAPINISGPAPILTQLSEQILKRPACARTLPSNGALHFADKVIESVEKTRAQGVIAHFMKFCDPYIARMPIVRKRLREAGIPLLLLEGDCALRSLGQHRTRIEAFVEMLKEV